MNYCVFTMVYGQHHINLFKEACFRSLNWPKNRAEIVDRDWLIYTKREHFEELSELFKNCPVRLNLIELGPAVYVTGVGMLKTEICDQGVVLLSGLRLAIKFCLEQKKRMLFAPPDTIFGDGTIAGLLLAGQNPSSAVCVAHPRVLPTIVDEISYLAATRGGVDNSKLVTMTMKHPHATWVQAERGHEKNSSFESGVVWSKLSDGLYQVQHRLPTPYLIDFTPDDWNFWWGAAGFGDFDHRWPGECFVRQERMRFIGSSDACYLVEITDHDKNVSNATPDDVKTRLAPDAFYNWRHHNSINRQFLTYYRGD